MVEDSRLEDILDEEHQKRGKLGLLADKLRAFGRTVYDVKLPLALASAAVGADRLLTYIGIGSGVASESNPLALAIMNAVGVVPGMIVTGVVGVASYATIGKIVENISGGKFTKNSLVSASLYGVAASEAVVSLNNYFVDYSQTANPFNQQFLQQYGDGSFIGLLVAAPLFAIAGAAAYQSLRSALKKRRDGPARIHA